MYISFMYERHEREKYKMADYVIYFHQDFCFTGKVISFGFFFLAHSCRNENSGK